jgi:heat shock protein HslJ
MIKSNFNILKQMKKPILTILFFLIFTPQSLANAQSLANNLLIGKWELVSYEEKHNLNKAIKGDWYIAFYPKGKVLGNFGCNKFEGNYQRDGNILVFSSFILTKMACAPEFMHQENKILSILKLTNFTIRKNILIISSQSKQKIVMLKKIQN